MPAVPNSESTRGYALKVSFSHPTPLPDYIVPFYKGDYQYHFLQFPSRRFLVPNKWLQQNSLKQNCEYILCPFIILSEFFYPFPGTRFYTISMWDISSRRKITQIHSHKVIMALLFLSWRICIVRDPFRKKAMFSTR